MIQFSFDADGCLLDGIEYTGPQPISMPPVIKTRCFCIQRSYPHPLLAHIKQLYQTYGHGQDILTSVFSNRQDYLTDQYNGHVYSRGGTSWIRSVAPAVRHIAMEISQFCKIDVILDKKLLADVAWELPAGTVFNAMEGKDDTNEAKSATYPFEEDKLMTIYMQSHRLAMRNPEGVTSDLILYDDRFSPGIDLDISANVIRRFNDEKKRFPHNVRVHLYCYAPRLGVHVPARIIVLKGDGPCDHYHDERYLKKYCDAIVPDSTFKEYMTKRREARKRGIKFTFAADKFNPAVSLSKKSDLKSAFEMIRYATDSVIPSNEKTSLLGK